MKTTPFFLLAGLATLTSAFAVEATTSCCPVDPHANHSMAGMPASAHSDTSLFNVSSLWENQDGKKQPLSQIGGKAQIVAMVYTTCKFACPRIIADIKAIQNELAGVSTDALGYCLITIDPERDTLAVYNEYAERNELSADKWTFLRGENGDVLELANLIGVKYKKTPDGEFSHSNILTLINAQGEIIHQQIGLGADPSKTVHAVHGLLHAAH